MPTRCVKNTNIKGIVDVRASRCVGHFLMPNLPEKDRNTV